MNTIRREKQPPEHFVYLPLDPVRAAKVLKFHFDAAQIREIVRLLHWAKEGGNEDGGHDENRVD